MKFHFPNKPVLEWNREYYMTKGQFVSYLKATRMISKGCIYHLDRVRDVDSETLTLKSGPIVNEYPEFFQITYLVFILSMT